MSEEFGTAPKGGWAKLVPELHVNDLAASLAFWRDVVGFQIAFQRPAEGVCSCRTRTATC